MLPRRLIDRVYSLYFIPQACRTWRSRLYCTYTDVLVLKPMYVCSLGRGAIAWFSCFEWCSTGGILSPYLFNVYMDDLIIPLNGCHTGYVGPS